MRLSELIEAGATIRVAGLLLERLTPRQLKFLFASGAILAGRKAGRLAIGREGSVKAVQQYPGARKQVRAAIKKGIQQHLQGYKADKATWIGNLMKFPSSQEAIMAGGRRAKKEYTTWARGMARGSARVGAGLTIMPWQKQPKVDVKKLQFMVGR